MRCTAGVNCSSSSTSLIRVAGTKRSSGRRKIPRRREDQAPRKSSGQASQETRAVRQSSKRRPKHFVERIQVGSTVRLRNGGKERGEVIAMHKNAATVLFGAFKSKIELEKLSWVAN